NDNESTTNTKPAFASNASNTSAAKPAEIKPTGVKPTDTSDDKDARPLRVAMRSTPPRTTPDADRRIARRTQPVVRTASMNDSSSPVAPKSESWPKRHTIESGDTLSEISMKYYGT